MSAPATARLDASAGRLPCLLAFDTSTERLAMAVTGAHGMLTQTVPGGAAASAGLLPLLREMLQQLGLPLQALQAVAFGRGPGAFTGLRTSCAVAQGLAWGLDLPVLPIDSLLIVADDALAQWRAGQPAARPDAQDFAVDVAVDARMEQAYCASYCWQQAGWHCTQPPALRDLKDLRGHSSWQAGSAWALLPQDSPAVSGQRRPPWTEQDRAAALARLAVAAWAAGQALDPAQALPSYLRDRVALTTAERLAARGKT